MNRTRSRRLISILSLVLCLTLFFGSAALGMAQAPPKIPSDHWVKQSPGITPEWHPLIDQLQSSVLLDAPMTRAAFEGLIQSSFKGLEGFMIPPGPGMSRETAGQLNITRMEGAFYLHHLLKAERILHQQLYTDQPDIPAWALEAVLSMTQKGIFKGFPDGKFKSHQWLTHAEAICLVAKSQLHWIKEGLIPVVPKPVAEEASPDITDIPGEQTPGATPVTPQPQAPASPEPAEPTLPVLPDPQPQPQPQPEPTPEPVLPPATTPQPDPLPDPVVPDPVAPTPAKATHDAEIVLILPPHIHIMATDELELYLIDPDLNTDPDQIETVQVLIKSYDDFERWITLTELHSDSDHFLAIIKPSFDPWEDPFAFLVNDWITSSAYVDYYDPVDALGRTNRLRSISFDIHPY